MTLLEVSETREPIYARIEAEREYQDDKWGGAKHDDVHDEYEWVALVDRQLHHVFACESIDDGEAKDHLVKAAAVIVAMIETIDRREERLRHVFESNS